MSITAATTAANAEILRACPSLAGPYTPCWFLPNAHVETVFAWAARRSPGVKYHRRCLSLSDGGLVALDFATDPRSETQVHLLLDPLLLLLYLALT